MGKFRNWWLRQRIRGFYKRVYPQSRSKHEMCIALKLSWQEVDIPLRQLLESGDLKWISDLSFSNGLIYVPPMKVYGGDDL